jgi:hypothetical protein
MQRLPFGEFLDELRRQGFGIGVEHHLRLQTLLDRLDDRCRPTDLNTLLAPIFATSQREQEAFHKIFAEWYPLLIAGTDAPLEAATVAVPVHPQPLPVPARRWPYLIVASALAVGIGFFVFSNLNSPAAPQPSTEKPVPVETPSDLTPPVTPAPELVRTVRVTAEAITPTFYENYWRPLRWLGILAPPIFLLAYECYRWRRRDVVARRHRDRRPPTQWPIAAPALKKNPYDPVIFHAVARLMRRRHASGQYHLDVPATVASTIRALGRAIFVYRAATRPPEYLVLIDRAAEHDHFAILWAEFFDRLAREGVFVVRLFFDGDPRRPVLDTGEPIILEDLHDRHAAHRLLLFGAGNDCIDPVSGGLADWFDIIRRWNSRAIFTPVPPSQWGIREVTLARELLVLPATVESVAAAVDAFDGVARTDLRSWRRISTDPVVQLSRPSIAELRKYLGDDAFQWLCACAVYPHLEWQLTLHLGTLPVMPEGLLSESNLCRLVRLMWFRDGAIPEDVRSRLVAALDPLIHEAVRRAIVELLEANPAPTGTLAEQQRRLHLLAQRAALDKRQGRQLRREASLVPAHVLRHDATVLAMLADRVTPLDFVLPAKARQYLFDHGIAGLGLRTAARSSMAAAIVATAWFTITPPPPVAHREDNRTESSVAAEPIAPKSEEPKPRADGGSPLPTETPTVNPPRRRQLSPAVKAMLGAWVTVGLNEDLRLNIAYNVREDAVTVEMRSGTCNDPQCASTYRASVAQKELLIDRTLSTGGTGGTSRASLNLIGNGVLAYNWSTQGADGQDSGTIMYVRPAPAASTPAGDTSTAGRDAGTPASVDARPPRPTPTLEESLVRLWVNDDPNTRQNTRLEIARVGSSLQMHAWGKCTPSDCDWGMAPVNIDSSNNRATVDWDQGFVTRLMTLVLLPDGRLQVDHVSDYNDGRPTRSSRQTFTAESLSRSLQVRVRDASATIIPEAIDIDLFSTSTSRRYHAAVPARGGGVSIDDVPADTYKMEIVAPSYLTRELPVTVRAMNPPLQVTLIRNPASMSVVLPPTLPVDFQRLIPPRAEPSPRTIAALLNVYAFASHVTITRPQGQRSAWSYITRVTSFSGAAGGLDVGVRADPALVPIIKNDPQFQERPDGSWATRTAPVTLAIRLDEKSPGAMRLTLERVSGGVGDLLGLSGKGLGQQDQDLINHDLLLLMGIDPGYRLEPR